MSFLRALFGPPNVEAMFSRRDVGGLIKALSYEKDTGVRQAAASALGQLGDRAAVGPLLAVLGDAEEDVDVRVMAAWSLASSAILRRSRRC